MTRQLLLSAACLSAAALLLLILGRPARAADSDATYADDDDGRRLARVGFEPVREGSATRLRLVVSATGPEVDPIAGFEGVAGENRFTAEQLERILDGSRRFTVLSRNLATGEQTAGDVRAGRRGFIPVRAAHADGAIDYLARWPRELPLELLVETGSMQHGRHETEIRVDGHVRAHVLSSTGTRGTEVLRFESLGGHGTAAPAGSTSRVHFLAELAAPGGAAKNVPNGTPPAPPLGVDRADWAGRDMEGKWALYQRLVAAAPESRAAWVPFLVAEKEFALLEWMALYQIDGFGSQQVGRGLFDADAPQWARVALWCRGNTSGYGDFEGTSLLNAKPGVILWWMRKYPQAAAEMPDLVKQLEMAKTPPVEAPHLLPPLKMEEGLAHLDAPAELLPFGDRTSAEPGRTYEQQVLRAIRGLVAAPRRTEAPWPAKLLALTRHPNASVRREAYLAYTYRAFSNLAWEDALRSVDDAKESARVREAAAAAFSYADHPAAVYVHLNRIAADPDHPAWSAAVSRLGDIGDGFARQRLSLLGRLAPHQTRLVNDSVKRIDSRLEREAGLFKAGGTGDAAKSIAKSLAARLAHAAWAEAQRHPIGEVLLPWTRETTRKQAAEHPAVRAALGRLSRFPSDAPWDKLDPAVRERAGALALEMLR